MRADDTPPPAPPGSTGAQIPPSLYVAETRHDAARDGAGISRGALLGYTLLALTVALAVVVTFVLPRLLAPMPAPVLATRATPTTLTTAPTADAADPLLSPAEKATARLDAQNALAAALELADALEARKADEWAATAWTAANARLADGETAYREERYPAALRAYAAATKRLQDIEQGIPDVVNDLVDDGERALMSTDGMAAQQAYERALALAPDDPRAQQGLARAKSLDRVLALLTEARGYETVGDAERARSAYREALTLDTQASEAAQALERLDRAREDKAYSRAMSAGYQALESQRFDVAKSSFEQASRLRPQSTEAANALNQTALRASAARIELALKTAANHERAERWTEAAGQYRAALAVDRNLDVANSGLARASARAAIDIELDKALAGAERLGDEAVYGQAQSLLDNARAVAAPGPKLKRQIAALAAAIKHARTPVTVMMQSDGQTEVSVTRIGHFKPFAQQQLTVLAGRYTAVGTRVGYRDVRVEFTVDPAAPPPVVNVRCTEAVNF